ncbi:MAG: LacI family DNA-binding transcriptional regulator [bacterium]|nr:LacI family DNA-binding transcriptional regulator [bacterium]
MNIYDISKEAGVSIATVSRVINGNTNVSQKTKDKVLAVIKECGYTPNAFARGLGLNTMNTVGISCADSSDPYLAKAIYYLEQMLRKNGYDVILCCTGYELEGKQKYLNLLLSKRVDAMILVGSNFVEAEDSKNDYIRLAAKKVPILILNGALSGENIYCALCDDFQAIYDATNALIQNGIKDILYLYNSKSYSGKQKLDGYMAALKDNGIAYKKELVSYFTGDLQSVTNHLVSLSQNGLDFKGIITSDDSLAVGAIKYAKALKLAIPEELSIIGYNNSIYAECCDPELTSIDNKLETVCKNCVSTLMGVFSDEQVPLKTIFQAEIVKRETTAF